MHRIQPEVLKDQSAKLMNKTLAIHRATSMKYLASCK